VAVSTAAEAERELNKVPSGGTALLLMSRGGEDTFITVKKE
jgi:hypothetical protein